MDEIILEAYKSDRKYKCPFCDHRDTRENLIHHISDNHNEMIPEDYSAARVLFNHLNKKEHGSCLVCKKETKWDESKCRYGSLCGSQVCHDIYVTNAKNNLRKVYGTDNLLDNPEFQKKMLANRSISGKYKFSDGGYRTYCGSYEKKLLEFYDKVMGAKSYEILTPGPEIIYEYDGKKHVWITDLYYIPYNLVHDVKDGGDNPNNREMTSYRAKQIAKEKTLEKDNRYNYIRLTDNKFVQLMYTLSELKYQLIDNNVGEHVYSINELAGMGALPPANCNDNIYIVNFTMDNSLTGEDSETAYSTDNNLQDMYKVNKDNKLEKVDPDNIKDMIYRLYKYTGDDKEEKLHRLDEAYKNQKEVSFNFIYEVLSDNKPLLNLEQYDYDSNFIEYCDGFEEMNHKKNIIESTIMSNGFIGKTVIDLFDNKDKKDSNMICGIYENVSIKQDINGYFAMNNISNTRTKSYKSINEIDNIEMYLVNRRD